ncbi:methyl-viologen-reducing hydrogenase subunit delta [candidate division WOR-3 bacterium RBG_13_43_14]|uniref:Methyl-viologen-reducing hydrogenase subunit delta n=1 Tax=candidate division WOR-3 bacterium RBG_13_43_14 TaxID=1802590 RepID=A0A1F4UF72_UNCW3|nr:MAG: methyl-viologen-reducing hydrogenase subunit delta [candidate division WOR-3 bacterium RBG_13_43_14]
MPDNKYEPKIIGFFCKWCTSAAADLAGTSRKQYPPNLVPIRFFCSSRLDPQQILHAFENGADGVMIGGCHFGDCHYQTGNYKTARRIAFLHDLLSKLGIDKRRLRLEWISAAEGDKFTRVITEFTKDIRDLGPLGGNGK